MLVRQKIQRAVIKHPGSTARELAKRLGMGDGAVAGHLNQMEKAGLASRKKDINRVSKWFLGNAEDKSFSMVTYIGNHHYRIYLEDGMNLYADKICEVLRKVMPEMKYSRVFTETVRVPVRRNYLMKL